jgi:hypothetical protein
MQAGMFLLGLVAVASAIASGVPDSQLIFNHVAFKILLSLLLIHTAWCTIRQLGPLIRRKFASLQDFGYRWSVWGIHCSVLLIGISVFWASQHFETRIAGLDQGQAIQISQGSNLNSLALSLKSMNVTHYSDGTVSDWNAQITINGKEFSVRVNKPAIWGTIKILLGAHQPSYSVELGLPGLSESYRVTMRHNTPLQLDETASFAFSLHMSTSYLDSAELRIFLSGELVQTTHIGVNSWIPLYDSGLELKVHSIQEGGVFIIRNSPGIEFLFISFACMCISVVGMIAFKEKI